MKQRLVPALACTLALLCALAPAGAAEPHVLRYSDGLDISSLNVFLATTGNIPGLDELTAAEFTRFDARGNAIPELITEIPSKANHGVSADGLSVTWHLRHNVKWSDGAPFDSADVVYTYHVAIDPNNNVVIRDRWERIVAVEAPDKYTVIFHFKASYSLFITEYFAANGNSAILPKHILGPGTSINDAPYNALPVGIGPFRYVAYHRGDSVEMEANPYYWRGTPKLKKVVYKIVTDDNTVFTQLQTGELDLWQTVNGTLADRVKTVPGKSTTTVLSNYVSAVFFNTQHPVVGDAAVRHALSMATNRTLVIDKIVLRNGILTESVVPKTAHDWLALPVTPFDPARAAKLLDAAGWARGANGIRAKNGVPLAVDLAIPSGYAPSATLANILHDDWGKLGVDVRIHTYATSQYFAIYAAGGIIQTGKFDAALYSQSIGPIEPDITGVYDCASIPPRGMNGARYCNPKVDALIDRYLRSYDRAVQARSAAAMQRQIDADLPAAVLYERTFLSAFDSHLSGYHPNSYDDWGDPLQLDI